MPHWKVPLFLVPLWFYPSIRYCCNLTRWEWLYCCCFWSPTIFEWESLWKCSQSQVYHIELPLWRVTLGSIVLIVWLFLSDSVCFHLERITSSSQLFASHTRHCWRTSLSSLTLWRTSYSKTLLGSNLHQRPDRQGD